MSVIVNIVMIARWWNISNKTMVNKKRGRYAWNGKIIYMFQTKMIKPVKNEENNKKQKDEEKVDKSA